MQQKCFPNSTFPHHFPNTTVESHPVCPVGPLTSQPINRCHFLTCCRGVGEPARLRPACGTNAAASRRQKNKRKWKHRRCRAHTHALLLQTSSAVVEQVASPRQVGQPLSSRCIVALRVFFLLPMFAARERGSAFHLSAVLLFGGGGYASSSFMWLLHFTDARVSLWHRVHAHAGRRTPVLGLIRVAWFRSGERLLDALQTCKFGAAPRLGLRRFQTNERVLFLRSLHPLLMTEPR